MSRKALFTSLSPATATDKGEPPPIAGQLADKPEATQAPANRMRTRPILGSPDLIADVTASPVGAIGQSLSEFSERAKRAEEIERKLTTGQTVIELDPALIDPSFISDRLPTTAAGLESLAAKIRDHGQLNPILVRPSGKVDGRFQVAFGHRRLAVATMLERPIKAVVRQLSDEELVIAQGQENHEREDLAFIEKCLFAHRMESHGFSRAVIMAAMSVYKSDLSNMLSVAKKIPEEIISAIGPASGIGRRGWIELVALFADRKAIAAVKKVIAEPTFSELSSDAKFKRAYAAAKPSTTKWVTESWSSSKGEELAKVTQNDARVSVNIDRRKSPEFAEFVLTRVRDLYQEFEAASSKRP